MLFTSPVCNFTIVADCWNSWHFFTCYRSQYKYSARRWRRERTRRSCMEHSNDKNHSTIETEETCFCLTPVICSKAGLKSKIAPSPSQMSVQVWKCCCKFENEKQTFLSNLKAFWRLRCCSRRIYLRLCLCFWIFHLGVVKKKSQKQSSMFTLQ